MAAVAITLSGVGATISHGDIIQHRLRPTMTYYINGQPDWYSSTIWEILPTVRDPNANGHIWIDQNGRILKRVLNFPTN